MAQAGRAILGANHSKKLRNTKGLASCQSGKAFYGLSKSGQRQEEHRSLAVCLLFATEVIPLHFGWLRNVEIVVDRVNIMPHCQVTNEGEATMFDISHIIPFDLFMAVGFLAVIVFTAWGADKKIDERMNDE